MTTNGNADPTRASTLAQQIVTLLIHEEPITRQRAIQAALMLLGEPAPKQHHDQAHVVPVEDGSTGLAAFFNRDDGMKPAENAQLCAAYHYSLYGAVAFSMVELKAIATDAGVVIPDRVDMTLRNAQQKGKKLFQTSGPGNFKPTAAACLHFAEKWKVRPGKNAKPTAHSKGTRDAQP